MFSFISNQTNDTQQTSDTYLTDDETITAEAIQGDAALILKVQELNELREYNKDAAA